MRLKSGDIEIKYTFLFLCYDTNAAQTVYYHCQTVRSNMFDDDGDEYDSDEIFRETAVGLVAGFARLAVRRGQMRGSEWIKQTRVALPVWMVNDETKIANFTASPAVAAIANKGMKAKRSRSPAFRGKGRSLDRLDRATRSKTKPKAISVMRNQN